MKLATRYVEVRPDTKNFRQDLERDTMQSASEVGKKLAGALAGGAFLAGAKKAIDAASDLNEAVNVTNITFGEAEGKVAAFAATAAESIGQSERAARQATATFGGLLLNLGYTEDAAASTSIQLTKLASDLGSAFNTDPAEAALALSSALRGEQEPILKYNVLLSDQAVRQEAVRLGLAASTAAVDENGKVQARLSLIMEQTSRIQGDFANTSEGAANAQRIAAAKAEDAAADMGDNLIPIYERLVAVVGSVADVFGALPEPMQTAVVAIAGIVALSGPVKLAAEAVRDLASIARTQLTKGLDTAATSAYSLSGNLGKVTGALGALGFAAIAAEIAISDYADTKAETKRIEDLYTNALVEQNGVLNENVRAVASNELVKGDLGERLRDAGANVALLTTGIFDQSEALTHLNNLYKDFLQAGVGDPLKLALEEAGLAGSALGDELIALGETGQFSGGHMVTLTDALDDQAEGYITGTREAENKATADEAVGVTAEGAAPKVEGLTDSLDANEQAAKDAAESVDLFREAVERAKEPMDFEEAVDRQAQSLADLAEDIEGRAQAVKDARERLADLEAAPADERDEAAIAEAKRDLADAIAATSLTLEGNTAEALRNREAIRGITDDSIGVIEKAREQGKSLEDLQIIRAMEIQSMRRQLEQMGFNKAEIERYIDQIEDIPLTRATTLTVDQAKAEANLKAAMDRLQAYIDANPLSMDVAQAEKFATGAHPNDSRGHAAGGSVFDGDFIVGEHGAEVLRKRGSQVDVIAGSPSAMFDALGEDQLLELRRQNALLEAIHYALGSSAGIAQGRAAAAVMG